MATLTVSFTAGSETGALLRRLAKNIDRVAAGIPDKCSTGATTVLTIDNGPATGVVSVQITSGPYTSGLLIA